MTHHDSIVDRLAAVGLMRQVFEDLLGCELPGNANTFCPLHKDIKTPSLSIDAEAGIWHCHGCGQEGGVLEFVRQVKSLPDLAAAAKWLEDHWGARCGALPAVAQPRPSPEHEANRARLGGMYERAASANSPDAVRILDEILLCAGDSDLLSAVRHLRADFVCISFSNGEGAVPDHARDLLRGRRVVDPYDADDAGREGLTKVTEAIGSAVTELRAVAWPAGFPGDLRDYLAQHGRKALQDIVRAAPLLTDMEDRPDLDETTDPKERKSVLSYPTTEAGSAEWFADEFGGVFRYDSRSRQWFMWAGHYWQPDLRGHVQQAVKRSARIRKAAIFEAMGTESAGEDKGLTKKRNAYLSWARASESDRGKNALLKWAQSEGDFPVTSEQLDRQPWLVACPNGVVDLRSGRRRDGDPADLITIHTPTPYMPDAECPKFLSFLSDVMAGDGQMVAYLQRALGYSLSGSKANSRSLPRGPFILSACRRPSSWWPSWT